MRGNAGQILAYCDTGLIPGSDCAEAAPIAPVHSYADDFLSRANAARRLELVRCPSDFPRMSSWRTTKAGIIPVTVPNGTNLSPDVSIQRRFPEVWQRLRNHDP